MPNQCCDTISITAEHLNEANKRVAVGTEALNDRRSELAADTTRKWAILGHFLGLAFLPSDDFECRRALLPTFWRHAVAQLPHAEGWRPGHLGGHAGPRHSLSTRVVRTATLSLGVRWWA